jgi:hypothetical protein
MIWIRINIKEQVNTLSKVKTLNTILPEFPSYRHPVKAGILLILEKIPAFAHQQICCSGQAGMTVIYQIFSITQIQKLLSKKII